ncbi:hypothetical protein C8R44DRAFT_152524 [Mycena epipterygia]|nr:hypothetical protein C8R44DRAFT_152524 [Mycena epipterygia]
MLISSFRSPILHTQLNVHDISRPRQSCLVLIIIIQSASYVTLTVYHRPCHLLVQLKPRPSEKRI